MAIARPAGKIVMTVTGGVHYNPWTRVTVNEVIVRSMICSAHQNRTSLRNVGIVFADAGVAVRIISGRNAHHDIGGNGVSNGLVNGLNALDVSTALCLYFENDDLPFN